MKKLLQSLAIFFAAPALAATTITTSTVSGTWTLAGSPYIVQVPVNVLAGETLQIDPGVTVQFFPAAKIDVSGMLVAKGTAAAPIVMEATDTTGWSNDLTTTGGWGGIHYKIYSGSIPDISEMAYCTIKDCKFGFTTVLNYYNPLGLERSISISHCKFYHNTSGMASVYSGPIISCITRASTDTITIDNCDIYDNKSMSSILYDENSNGYCTFSYNHFYNNYRGGPIHCNSFNGIIYNNEIENNEVLYDAAPITVGGVGSVHHNRIHHNIFERDGAIHCMYGTLDIDNNIICNNFEVDAFVCSGHYCTSGVFLASNSGSSTNHYRFRNNIIANNASKSGGSALSVGGAYAEVTNNTIVNNNASGIHRSITLFDNGALLAEVHIKNNIIVAPEWTLTSGTLNAEALILVHSATSKIEIDYNYMSAPYYKAIFAYFPFTILGDTTHNIVGTAAAVVAPTADDVYTTDATTANFSLTATSPCINAGTATDVSALATDYAGAPRITNGTIDIGAYEYESEAGTTRYISSNASTLTLYPNPAHKMLSIVTPVGNGNLYITDMSGRVVISTTISKTLTSLSITSIPAGIYFVQFAAPGIFQTEKIVIE